MATNITDKIGVTGHQNLPLQARSLITQRLIEWFLDPERVEVVCSLAVGADSVVADYLCERGARLHAIIPCASYESTFETDRDLSRYRKLLGKATVIEQLGFEEPSEEAYMAAGSLVVRSSDWLLAVWDGKQARGLGGTGDAVTFARSLGKQVRVVWPEGLER